MICDKCGREVHPWPLKRGAKCAPPEWMYCIRNDGRYRFSKPDFRREEAEFHAEGANV